MEVDEREGTERDAGGESEAGAQDDEGAQGHARRSVHMDMDAWVGVEGVGGERP